MKQKFYSVVTLFLMALFLMLSTGCGGGGSSSTTTTDDTTAGISGSAN